MLERIIVLLLLCAGCAEGDAPPEGEGGAAPVGPFDAFAFRSEIVVSEGAPAGCSIAVVVDHEALVAAEKAEADGSDLFVVYDDGELAEIDRVLEPTSEWDSATTIVWFRSGGEGKHWLYYGREGGDDAPKADPAAVFELFDGFEAAELDAAWTARFIGGATGEARIEDGAARVSTVSGDIGGTSDSLSFLGRELSGDFVVDVAVRGHGGSLGAASKVGGAMVRQSPLADARFVMLSGQTTPEARVRGVRPIDGDEAELSASLADLPYPQLFSVRRLGDEFSVSYSDDAVTWIGVGDEADVSMLDPVLVGFPIANISAGSGHVDVEYFRVRQAVVPAPTAALGDEEAL